MLLPESDGAMSTPLIPATCPVCSHNVAAPFFEAGAHPLATLGWPAGVTEAQAMRPYPQDYVQCPQCTHIWNCKFSYDAIPYQKNPNRMFNNGINWKGHLAATGEMLLARLPRTPTVVDVGCGEGHFVRALANALEGAGRFVGFDPNATAETGVNVEFHSRYFQPLQDMPEFAPDAITIRHVLEHLSDPASLLEQMAWGAASLGKPCWLFAEVPCIDRAIETGRLVDFFYEHPSQFTTSSFKVLLERAGEIVELAHGYDQEVVYALVRLGVPAAPTQRVAQAANFHSRANAYRSAIRAQLSELAASGKKFAIWGGTGKAAAFINQYGADAQRFPLVVDSDPDKSGTFVPGTGQEIVFRDILKTQPADVVIIPTQWRARDIVAEMTREGMVPALVLIEHQGRLIDFMDGDHPYR